MVPQTVQPAHQQTTRIITTLHSHKPATPEQFLCFQLIKISEFPQPSVNTMMTRPFSPQSVACVFPCRAGVLSDFLSHKPKACSKPGNNPCWDTFLWITIDMLLANILYALCLFFEESWTSVDGGKSSDSLVQLPLWWGTVYSTILVQMWLSGKMLTFPRVVFPWIFWIQAPSCVDYPPTQVALGSSDRRSWVKVIVKEIGFLSKILSLLNVALFCQGDYRGSGSFLTLKCPVFLNFWCMDW